MLEIACFNAHSASLAAAAGADRIEFCADYAAGGVTPDLDSLVQIRQSTTKPVNVMIRPRSGDFTYSDSEFAQMESAIESFKDHASGLVFGILTAEKQVDVQRCRILVQQAAPLPCTFHRAIDQVPDLFVAAEQVIECGFTSILTSGGAANAASGVSTIGDLQRRFGHRLSLIVGGGVRSTNIESLGSIAKVKWYHSAAITQEGEMVDVDEIKRLCARLANQS